MSTVANITAHKIEALLFFTLLQLTVIVLAARIGMRPKGVLPASRPANPKSDGSAPWRKALRS